MAGARKLPEGTVTLLFTDIEGSTRLLHELGERYTETLAEHRRVVRAAATRHGGVEVDTQGDSFFFAFARAGDAVAAAGAAQGALSEGPVRVRMGLHTGEPVVTDEGYIGMDVHRAARICAAAHGGQIVLSRRTRELLEPHIPLEDLGEHRLKDLDRREWLYQLLLPGLPQRFPPLKSLNNTNLPAEATSLIGRKRELAEVVAFLADGNRLLTLTGPGGTGKTRLALRAASELVERFRNGVFLVALAQLRDPALVIPAIAQSLGTRESPEKTLLATLAADLEEKELLLVLDNCEQVLAAAPEVALLLKAAPRLSVLATSRERLRITGEHEYAVPPLTEDDAVELFLQRGQATARGLLDREREAVAEICRRLDGLPLAIELAAVRSKLLSPPALLARLARRLPLLTGGPRDAPQRQRTLRATIEWSHQLLEEEEQRLFARLATFNGGCTLGGAEAVCDARLDTLSSLVDKSLIRRGGGADAEPRFLMLETIREYALDRLEESGEAQQQQRRHAEFFLGLVEEAAAELARSEQALWFRRLEAEHDNLRAALSWLDGAGERNLQLRFVVALTRFWYVRGHFTEARGWLRKALASGDEDRTRLRAHALTAASALALIQGDYPEATRLAEASLVIAREQQDVVRISSALSNLGAIVLAAGDTRGAAPLLEEAVVLSRGLGTTPVAARALNNLGDLALTVGEYERAGDLFLESFKLLQELGDTYNMARSLFNLGAVALQLGRHREAHTHLRESISICWELQDKEDLAWCLEGFAALAAAEDKAERATALLGAAGAVLEETRAAFKPFERQLHERTLATLRHRLDEGAFSRAWQRGHAMTLKQAVEYALGEDF